MKIFFTALPCALVRSQLTRRQAASVLLATGVAFVLVAGQRSAWGAFAAGAKAGMPQTISFPQPAVPAYAGTSVVLGGTASSGLPVSYTVVSGPATVAGSTLTYTGVGTVTVEADQAGDSTYGPAAAVQDAVAAAVLTEPLASTSAAISTVVTFSAAGALGTVRGLTQGATGLDFNLAAGGTCAVGATYAVGDTCTAAFTFTPTRPGLRFGGLTFTSAAGDLLANSYVYGLGNGPQAVFTPATQSSIGSGFTHLSGAAVDGNGNVYVSDLGGTVNEIPANGGPQLTFGPFPEAADIAVDGSGNVFVCTRSTVSELLAVDGMLPAQPVVRTLSSGFVSLNGMKVDGNGNIFLASGDLALGNSGIFELEAVDGSIPSGAPTKTLAANVGGPTGVAIDLNGDVFFSEQRSHSAVELVAVNGTIPATPTLVTLTAGFNLPSNIARDAAGNLYVTDAGTGSVDELQAVNGVVPVGAPVIQITTGLISPQGLGLDAAGNIIVADSNLSSAVKLEYADAPTLNFADTVVGGVSSDSPKTVTILNDGNEPLEFASPATGFNPTITPGFTLDSGSTCPLLTPGMAAPGLEAGASCTDVVSFRPIAGGVDHGTLVTTDNNHSVPGSTQTVVLNGVGIVETVTISMTAVPNPVFLLNPVTLTATVGSNVGTPTGSVVFFEGGTGIGTAGLTGGVGSLTISNLGLGSHSIRAIYSSSVTGTVVSSPVSVLVEDFSVTAIQPELIIQHGGTATYTFTVSPVGGATMPADIGFTLVGAPRYSVLSFAPSPVAAGSGTTTLTLTVQTPNYPVGPFPILGQAAGMSRAGMARSGAALAMLGLGALLLPFGRGARLARGRGRRLLAALVVVAASLMAGTLAGCGTGWGTQYYVIDVTGSSGPLAHQVTVRLTSE